MKRVTKLSTRIVTAIAAATGFATPFQVTAQVRQDRQLWVNFSAQGELGKRKVWVAEVQPRLARNLSVPSVLLGRMAVGYEVNDRITIYQGFVYQELLDGATRHEKRSYQQADLDVASGTWGTLKARLRLEQRWFSNGSEMGLRFREQLRYEKALTVNEEPLVGVLTAEAFANVLTADYGARRGFESARLFAGVRIPIDEQSTETGYQAQISAPPGDERRLDHVLLVTFRLRP